MQRWGSIAYTNIQTESTEKDTWGKRKRVVSKTEKRNTKIQKKDPPC